MWQHQRCCTVVVYSGRQSDGKVICAIWVIANVRKKVESIGTKLSAMVTARGKPQVKIIQILSERLRVRRLLGKLRQMAM